jgi:hypothetical protein
MLVTDMGTGEDAGDDAGEKNGIDDDAGTSPLMPLLPCITSFSNRVARFGGAAGLGDKLKAWTDTGWAAGSLSLRSPRCWTAMPLGGPRDVNSQRALKQSEIGGLSVAGPANPVEQRSPSQPPPGYRYWSARLLAWQLEHQTVAFLFYHGSSRLKRERR